MGTWIILILVTVILFSIYVFLKKHVRYWKDRGVPYVESNLIFGSALSTILGNTVEFEMDHSLYKQLAPHNFGGLFMFLRPILMIRDPELIKHVLVKDFSYFNNRSEDYINEKDILSFSLVNLTGSMWKKLRTKLATAFSPAQIKICFSINKNCGETLCNVLDEMLQKSADVEVNDLLARYCTDVISVHAFGVETNSLQNPKAPLREMGVKIFRVDFNRKLFMILNLMNPAFPEIVGVKEHKTELGDFFLKFVSESLRYRAENKIQQNDFLNSLMRILDNSNGALQEDNSGEDQLKLTTELMAGLFVNVFTTGFLPVSNTLSYCLLELSRHPEFQTELRNEVDQILLEENGELTYPGVQKMSYMDQVLSETMRMYPVVSSLFRQCNQSYRIPNSDIVIEKDTPIIIPVYGLHYDPEYFPNPDTFDPNHFSEESKRKRHRYTYLPFGDGPRMCLGFRLALIEMKTALAMLVSRYEFKLSRKMKFPLKYQKYHPHLQTIDGVWITVSQRSNSD